MCGIVAQVGSHSRQDLEGLALDELRHRGPDSGGQWWSPDRDVWLGHRRLSIVDLTDTGHQPMHNENQTVWLVCNGEIYNYPSLRRRLEALGHTFYSNCDSEAILHAYEAWGDECVDQLEGMFAFILWDTTGQRMLAARDRVGIKPLCYARVGQGLVLASEASALLPLLPPKPPPEPLAVAYVMTLGYVPSPWSIWQGIRKLEPGHVLTWERPGEVRQRCYWEPPRHIESDATNDETWQRLFESVLAEHLLSDVPIGLFLSGGLDSSSVAAGLRDIGRPVQAITVSFPDSVQDESPVATAVADHLGLAHRVVPLKIDDVDELIQEVAAAYDEPQGYSALLSMYLISHVAAQELRVVLAGDGGDELFGGYTWYRGLNGGTSGGGSWLRRVARSARAVVRQSTSPALREQVAFAETSPLHRHAWRVYPRFLPNEAEALLSPMGLAFGEDEMLAPLRKHFEPQLPLKRALQRVDLMTFCTDSILAKADRASMAHSLEVRVPFLDRRIIEWALVRPIERREDVESKPMLRDYIRSRVPASVLAHPKQGFSLRVLDQFDWDAATERVGQGPWVKDGYWSPNWKHLLELRLPYRTGRIWNLLALTCWAEAWLGGSKGCADP
jgi:asparagine synthase (glutamine-hydrolysing)